MRVLYVEDHALFASIVTDTFLTEHDVERVDSIATALQRPYDSYDAVLVDYDLPDGKGTAVVRHVRATHPQLPIVAVSSHDRGNAALLEAGANAACRKDEAARLAPLLARIS